MSAKITDETLDQVRQWAADGVDLNGIQKKLQTECGLHLTYMDVRFLLLDHGIEIASPAEAESAPSEPTEESRHESSTNGRPKVTLDDLTLPGTIFSGKVEFPGGTSGSWLIDQMGRFGWRELNGNPSPEEMSAFQQELSNVLSQG